MTFVVASDPPALSLLPPNARVRATAGVVSAAFGTVSYFALYQYPPPCQSNGGCCLRQVLGLGCGSCKGVGPGLWRICTPISCCCRSIVVKGAQGSRYLRPVGTQLCLFGHCPVLWDTDQGCAWCLAYGAGGGGRGYEGIRVCEPEMALSFLALYSKLHSFDFENSFGFGWVVWSWRGGGGGARPPPPPPAVDRHIPGTDVHDWYREAQSSGAK